ncbi:DNA topoisomerase IV subunit A [Sesbania bispinosa]|nr:DNA topoisomerase IV subunit A [Sesbania bispinosa]
MLRVGGNVAGTRLGGGSRNGGRWCVVCHQNVCVVVVCGSGEATIGHGSVSLVLHFLSVFLAYLSLFFVLIIVSSCFHIDALTQGDEGSSREALSRW